MEPSSNNQNQNTSDDQPTTNLTPDTTNQQVPPAESPAQTNQNTNPQPYQQPTGVPANQSSAGIIVLQWLTYAFWGWTILAMSILTSLVYTSLLTDSDIGGSTPYSIASVLVLLPIAVTCEVLYKKREPAKKTGAASIVMVIHAVIFALFGIAATIGAVFFLVSLFTEATQTDGQKVGIFSTLTIAVFYGVTFLRTLNPQKIKNLPKIYTAFMISLVGIITVLAIVGPVAKERRTRNDRLITSNIGQITSEISSYARQNNRLPDRLSDLDLKDDKKTLVDRDLLKYTPNSKEPTNEFRGIGTASSRTTYYYELCATFAEAKDNDYSYSSYSSDDGYDTYLRAYSHDKGENCYKMKTTAY